MSYPQLDPVNNYNYYSNQPPQMMVYPGNQISAPLVYSSYPVISHMPIITNTKRPRLFGLILLILVLPQIFLQVISLYFAPWFKYCYWDFSLSYAYKLPHKDLPVASSRHSLDSLYDILCKPDEDYFPMCPDLCGSLRPIASSWKYMSYLGFAALICSVLVFLMILIKVVWIRVNKPKYFVWLFHVSALLTQVIGFGLYVYYSKFMKNFDDTENYDSESYAKKKRYYGDPEDLNYRIGTLLAVAAAGSMLFNLFLTSCLLSKVFKPPTLTS